MPDPYHYIRRRMLADSQYTHEPVPGYMYKIIERQVIRKPIQQKIGLFQQ